MPRWLSIISLLLALLCTTSAHALDAAQLEGAMARMRDYLYDRQLEDGSWETTHAQGKQAGGETALATLALLKSGESWQQPKLERAITWLLDTEMRGTYAISLRAHVWAQLPDAFLPMLERDARWLLAAANDRACFSYGDDATLRFDHSATQYGLLGLWEAQSRGIEIPDELWPRVEQHFISTQQAGGGWGYQPGHKPTGSMTAAGVTCLLMAQRARHLQKMTAPAELSGAIDAGLAWLDQYFRPDENPGGGYPYYHLYGIARVALACGEMRFNGRPWFEDGAAWLLSQQRDDGSVGTVYQTAFALLFLSRGQAGAWATKLHGAGWTFNDRPNDLPRLSAHLSQLREQRVGFQAARLNQPAESWLSAPVAYLSTGQALSLTPSEKDNLRRFIDLGGLLWVNPDLGAGPAIRSVEKLAAELYPQWPMQPTPADHPLFNLLHQTPPHRVLGVSNGVRDLILMPVRDWGYDLQARSADQSAAWPVMTNLFLLATDRGLLPDRPFSPLPEDAPPTVGHGQIVVARPAYDGNWLPEPAAWVAAARRLAQAGGPELVVTGHRENPLPLAKLDQSQADVAHLAGVEATELTRQEIDAIANFTRSGGTVLLECVGGMGSFTRSVERQLTEQLGSAPLPLPLAHPLVTGEGLPGGADVRRVFYRRFAVTRLGPLRRPRLAAYMVGGRPAVIVSDVDLSLGTMGVRRWGVLGYSPPSARGIMHNVLLFAHAHRQRQPAPAQDPAVSSR